MDGRLRGHDGWRNRVARTLTNVMPAEAGTHDTLRQGCANETSNLWRLAWVPTVHVQHGSAMTSG